MLLWNTIGGGVLIGWNLVTGIIIFVALERMGVLRVHSDDEIQGLDLVKHNERAYGFGTGTSPKASALQRSHTVLNVAALANNKVEALAYPMNVSA